MDNQPLISVLIANYNNGKFLQECLDSILVQTYKNWEVIIVDDCSTDDFSDLIYNKYKDNPKIKIFYNESNRGCGFTKRSCVSNASGELCAFLDPDDTITEKACEKLVVEHLKHSHHSLVYSTHYICDGDLNIIKVNPHVGQIPKGESQLTYNGPRISHFAMFKKSFYNKTVGIDSTLTTSVDQDLYFKLEEVGPVLFVNIPMYCYRHHSNSISLNKNQTKAFYTNVMASYNAYRRRLKTGNEIPNLSFKEISRRRYKYFIWNSGICLNNKEYSNFFKSWSKSLKYFYWDKNAYIPRLAFRGLKEFLTHKIMYL